jgi:hypothetical protein
MSMYTRYFIATNRWERNPKEYLSFYIYKSYGWAKKRHMKSGLYAAASSPLSLSKEELFYKIYTS